MKNEDKFKEEREKKEDEYKRWVEEIKAQWEPGEWDEFRKKLEELSLEDLRELTTKVGIKFAGGNENIIDTKNLTAKEQFILVLDEADKDELMKEYEKIIESKK
jgi:Fe-S cluster assembly ATPase SufC